MELIKAIILGAIQGLTEFLPISSSGHLVIASEFMEFQQQGVVFDVFLHLGTLLSVVIVFRQEIRQMILAPLQVYRGEGGEQSEMYLKWDLYIIAATIPAVIVGLFFKESIEHLFTNLTVVYCMLLVTAVLMISAHHLKEGQNKLTLGRAVLIGCAQACAILPGLSRSGSTIFTGMALGVNREVVARFSFIMSIPAILGAAVLQSRVLFEHPPSFENIVNIIAGTATAALSGYFAIVLLLDIVRRNRLQYFGYYCLVLAIGGFCLHFFS